MSMTTRRSRRIPVMVGLLPGGLLLTATIGCSTDVSGFRSIGSFELTVLNEAALPTTLADGTEVLSGSIDLNSEARCRTRTVVVRPGAAQEETTTECTWSQSNGNLAIVWPEGSASSGVVEGATVAYLISVTTPGCPPVTGASCAFSQWVYER
jgi:hypothetical protein